MPSLIKVANLRKTYHDTVAVNNISFTVQKDEIFGIVGPNGAGKTTTIECLEGLRKPDEGSILVLGLDPQKDKQALKYKTGVQLQQSNLPQRMKVWEALDLYASFYPSPLDWRKLTDQLGLEEKLGTPFAKLSGGQKQRLFICLALLPDPEVVFLDELTTGLDPQARHAMWDLIKGVRSEGKTILLTTHFMEEAERLCDRVLIMDHGDIIALDSPEVLVNSLGTEERVSFSVDEPLPAGFVALFSKNATVEIMDNHVKILGKNKQPPLVSEVVTELTARGIRFHDLRTEQANLEDVFLKLTSR